jgi:hypothetical protein
MNPIVGEYLAIISKSAYIVEETEILSTRIFPSGINNVIFFSSFVRALSIAYLNSP